MMLGSFIRSTDVEYSGSLATTVDFNESAFKEALSGNQEIVLQTQGALQKHERK